jgi:hypothetical protein
MTWLSKNSERQLITSVCPLMVLDVVFHSSHSQMNQEVAVRAEAQQAEIDLGDQQRFVLWKKLNITAVIDVLTDIDNLSTATGTYRPEQPQ